jgi:hypothetical protein
MSGSDWRPASPIDDCVACTGNEQVANEIATSLFNGHMFTSSSALTAPAGFLAGRGGDAQGRRHLHRRRGVARLRAARHPHVGLRAPRVCPASSRSASSWTAGHLGDRGTIAAGGDRGVRQAHPLFQHLWRGNPVSCAGACGSEGHQGRPAAGADQRDGHEGQILTTRPPLVFSLKDAKLFLATLDEVLTALWRTAPAGLPVQVRGRWDQGA